MPDFSGLNDHQLIALVVCVWLTTIGGIVHLIIKQRQAARDARAAAEYARPTGNGFAQTVKDSLKNIERTLDEFRTESRTNDARIEHRLDEHMNNHDRRNNDNA